VENLNTSNIKEKSSKKYLIYLADSLNCPPPISFNASTWELTDNINIFDVHIQNSPEQYVVKYKVFNRYRTHLVKKANLDITLKHVYRILNSKGGKNTSAESKNHIGFTKNEKFWCQDHFLISELRGNFLKSKSIIDFTKSFLTIPKLSLFKTIHLFIHEKGNTNSKHVQIEKLQVSNSDQHIQEFTTLYQAIKKSKDRSFGQSSLKAANFHIIGTCLAYEFSLKDHNLIFLISKNDFLPQEVADIEFFNDFVLVIKPFLSLILSKELLKNTINNSKNLIRIIETISETKQASIQFQNIEDALDKIKKIHFSMEDVNHQERIKLLGELLNTLKHELSNPLFGLQLTTEVLLMENLDCEQTSFVEEISNAIRRCQNIIENFSQIYNEEMKLENVNIIKLLNEVFTLTKSESKTVSKEILLNGLPTSFESNDIFLNVNQTWLAQIFFNLIINSSQALNNAQTIKPLIKIHITTDDSEFKVTFIDNGPGLDAITGKNAFNPFYTTKKEGTGLGLAITKSLILKLNGNIQYIPSDNGAKFEIRLPYENANR